MTSKRNGPLYDARARARTVGRVARDDRQCVLAAVAVNPEFRLIEDLIDRRPEAFVFEFDVDARVLCVGLLALLFAIVDEPIARLLFDCRDHFRERHILRGERDRRGRSRRFCRTVLDLLSNAREPLAHRDRHLVRLLRQSLEEPIGLGGRRSCEVQQFLFGRVAFGGPVVVQLADRAADLAGQLRIGFRLRRFVLGRACGHEQDKETQ